MAPIAIIGGVNSAVYWLKYAATAKFSPRRVFDTIHGKKGKVIK